MHIAQHPEKNIEPQECNSTQAKNNMKNKKKSLILQQKNKLFHIHVLSCLCSSTFKCLSYYQELNVVTMADTILLVTSWNLF